MLFSCGETAGHYEDRIKEWHRWFAWHPVRVDTKEGYAVCAWLQTVERKGKLICWVDGCHTKWEYRYAR